MPAMAEEIRPHKTERRSMRALARARLCSVFAGRRADSVATCSRWPSAWVVPGRVLAERSPRVSAVASVQRRRATQARPAVPADPRAPHRLVVVVGGTARTGRCPPKSALVRSPMTGERQAMAEEIRSRKTERRSMRAVARAPRRCVSAGRRAGSVATRPRMPNALAERGSVQPE
jgi:hypothetical protein